MPTLADALGYEPDEPQATTPPRQRTQDIDLPTGPRGRVTGLKVPGNVDLFAQPEVPNPITGGTSTVWSRSFGFEDGEYLLPRVTPDGRLLTTDEETIAEFKRTGRHLGIFESPKAADTYASQLHQDYEAGKFNRAEEAKFKAWYAPIAKQWGLNPDPDAKGTEFDYRAARRAGDKPDASGHWGYSQGKSDQHPTAVVGGFDTRTGQRVPGTRRMNEKELVMNGWSPAAAKQLAATPEPKGK